MGEAGGLIKRAPACNWVAVTALPRQFGPEYASIFKDPSVVRAYRHRPGYPPETFEILAELLEAGGPPRAVLDAGCGTGFLARELARRATRVDAVDFSSAMIETGRRLPGGNAPGLRWIRAPVEEAILDPPYALIVAGESVHWMEWDVALRRFGEVLAPGGYVAFAEIRILPSPWSAELRRIASRYSMNRDYRPYDVSTVAADLERRGLFRELGARETGPVAFRQSTAELVESLHARNGFSRDRMPPAAARECDRRLLDVLSRHCPDGRVELTTTARVIWGRPGPL